MKKKVLLRTLVGAPLGFLISSAIALIISFVIGDGAYYPVIPALIEDCGGELRAVLLQGACSLLYGAAWGGASVIWEMERWSLLRQTVTHLVICSSATFPVAYFMRWMPRNVGGIFGYYGIFLGIYAFIWLMTYVSMRARVRAFNQKVQEKKTV